MPTTKHRYQVTETADIAAAIETAAQHWPEDRDRPARLVVRLIEAGHRAIELPVSHDVAARQQRIMMLAGSMSGVDTGPGAIMLEELDGDWPE